MDTIKELPIRERHYWIELLNYKRETAAWQKLTAQTQAEAAESRRFRVA